MLQGLGGRTSAIKSSVGSGLCLHPQLTHGPPADHPKTREELGGWALCCSCCQADMAMHCPLSSQPQGGQDFPHFTEEATEARRHDSLVEGTS